MNIVCDLHMHSALSPCALEEMTPNNMVNMALLQELTAIAVTDHNSCRNAAAVMEVAQGTGLSIEEINALKNKPILPLPEHKM